MCKIIPCVNTHIYADGMCYYHYRYGSDRPKEEKTAKPIPKASKKRAKENRVDQQQNKEIRKQNPNCQMKLQGCTGKTEGVHHMKGRTGKLLTDPKFKIPACNACNRRAETHPQEAQAKGVSKSRLSKN